MMDFDAIRHQIQRKAPQMLTCYCCGTVYPRGRYACCAPPNGMPSHEWAQQWCKPKDAGGCGCCQCHCRCGAPVAQVTSLSAWLEKARKAVDERSVAEIFEEGEQ